MVMTGRYTVSVGSGQPASGMASQSANFAVDRKIVLAK